MKRWIWDKFIKKWFWEEVAAIKKTQNQRNYIEDMLKKNAQGVGLANSLSYIYGVNEARSQAFITKQNKGYDRVFV